MAMTKPKMSKRKEAEEKATSPKKHSDAKQDMKMLKAKVKKSCMK